MRLTVVKDGESALLNVPKIKFPTVLYQRREKEKYKINLFLTSYTKSTFFFKFLKIPILLTPLDLSADEKTPNTSTQSLLVTTHHPCRGRQHSQEGGVVTLRQTTFFFLSLYIYISLFFIFLL